MKPVIGILSVATRGVARPAFATGADYVRAVEQAGGLPLLLPLPPSADDAVLTQWLALCSGILLPGGGDVAAKYFGEDPVPQVTESYRLRDEVEIKLCRMAARCKKPVLGICRGMQTMNVAFGGTLWQDIPSQYPHALCHAQDDALRSELFHALTLVPESMLAQIMGDCAQESNTFHHQAVKAVAPGFMATAHAPDGLIEAIENRENRMLGVQWHPENLACIHAPHAAVFVWLVRQSAVSEL